MKSVALVGVTALAVASCLMPVAAQTVLRPMVGIGLVGAGGDEVTLTPPGKPSRSPAKVSGWLHFYGGAMYQPTASSAVTFTVGLQAGTTGSGTRKSYEFSRIPVELGYHHEFMDGVSVGVGLRKSLSPKVNVQRTEQAYQPHFSGQLGEFVQLRLGGENLALLLRYVNEKFKSPELGTVNGNHAGIYVEWAR